MRMKMIVALALAGSVCAHGTAQTPATPVSDVWKVLNEPVTVKDFQGDMSFKDFVMRLQERFKKQGKELPLSIDNEAFREENPDAPSIYDTIVRFAEVPARMTCAEMLRGALAGVNPPNATFLVRPGVIEITTIARSTPDQLLCRTVQARFFRRPLEEVLDELYERTGVAVVLDRRCRAAGADANQRDVDQRHHTGHRFIVDIGDGRAEAARRRQRHLRHHAGAGAAVPVGARQQPVRVARFRIAVAGRATQPPNGRGMSSECLTFVQIIRPGIRPGNVIYPLGKSMPAEPGA